MDLVPELGHLFGSFCFGYIGLTTLLHWGESGEQSFCLTQRSQYTQPLNPFGEGILCIFDTGKAQLWCVVYTFHWKETGLFFQPSKVPSKGDLYQMKKLQ